MSFDNQSLSLLRKLVTEIEPPPPDLTTLKIIENSPLGSIKIRAYSSEKIAVTKAYWLNKLAGEVAYPELLHRWREYLIFRYVPSNCLDKNRDSRFYRHIGKFLATINKIQADRTTYQNLDDEFETWIQKLTTNRILPQNIASQACDLYSKTRPHDLPIVLDYWDAMPHNFGVPDKHTFLLLDEKHLRPSFPGIGLIKPLFLLPPEHWQDIQSGYEKVNSLRFLEEHLTFLKFYYLVNALHFYLLASNAGRVTLPLNLRFLSYRDMLINLVADRKPIARIRGEIELFLVYPRQTPFLLRRLFRKNKNELTYAQKSSASD